MELCVVRADRCDAALRTAPTRRLDSWIVGACDGVARILLAFAADRATAPGQLTELSRDRASSVRWAVAGNPHVPLAAVTRLTHDPEPMVAAEAMKHAPRTGYALARRALRRG